MKKRLYPIREFAYEYINQREIDNIIYEYERLPQSAKILLEKQTLYLGEETTIIFDEFKDITERMSHSWWRILVKTEHGEITNGIELDDHLYAFEIGATGRFAVQYKAPTDCPGENLNDTVSVFCSCAMWDNATPLPEEERVLACATLELICPLELEVQFITPQALHCTESAIEIGRVKLIPVSDKIVSGTIPFSVNFVCYPAEDSDKLIIEIDYDAELTFDGVYKDTESGKALEVTVFANGWAHFYGYCSEEARAIIPDQDTLRAAWPEQTMFFQAQPGYFCQAVTSRMSGEEGEPQLLPLVEGSTTNFWETEVTKEGCLRAILHLGSTEG